MFEAQTVQTLVGAMNGTFALAMALLASAVFIEFPGIIKKRKIEAVCPAPVIEAAESAEKYKEKMDQYYHKIQLYELLIKKYAEHIEQTESKTVQDLKAAVQPNHPRIRQLCESIREKSGSTDVAELCKRAYEEIAGDIHSVAHIGISFWLSIDEMLDNKIADYEDKAILLCSVFRAFDTEARVIVTELSGGSNRPLVLLQLGETMVLCDPNTKHDFSAFRGTREQAFSSFHANGESVLKQLYEFNDKEYIQHES